MGAPEVEEDPAVTPSRIVSSASMRVVDAGGHYGSHVENIVRGVPAGVAGS
jgi:hypothetical protein